MTLLRRVGFPVEETAGEFGRKTFSFTGDVPVLHFAYAEALAFYLCRRAAIGFGETYIEASLQHFDQPCFTFCVRVPGWKGTL